MDVQKGLEGDFLSSPESIVNPRMPAIAVTGCDGFLGRHLVRALKRRFRIFELTRRSCAKMEHDSHHARVQCDIRIDESVSRAVSRIEAITRVEALIHLAAVKRYWLPENVFYETNVQGTQRMIWAARRFGVRQFVFSSTSLVYAKKKNPYSASKIQAERLVRDAQLPYTIIRFTPLFGEGDDSNFTRLAKLVGKSSPIPIVPLIGSGEQKIQPLFVQDAAAAVEAVLLHEQHFNKEYDLSGFDTSPREMIATAARHCESGKLVFGVPLGLARLIARICARMADRPMLTIQQLDSLDEQIYFDSSATWAKLEVERTTLDEAISELVCRNDRLNLRSGRQSHKNRAPKFPLFCLCQLQVCGARGSN